RPLATDPSGRSGGLGGAGPFPLQTPHRTGRPRLLPDELHEHQLHGPGPPIASSDRTSKKSDRRIATRPCQDQGRRSPATRGPVFGDQTPTSSGTGRYEPEPKSVEATRFNRSIEVGMICNDESIHNLN